MNYRSLISAKFVTEKKNLIEVWFEYRNGFYHFRIAKNHRILGSMDIPDSEDMQDVPMRNNEDLNNKFAEMLPHLQSVLKIIEKP